MASERTKLTELGTAVGLVLPPDAPWPAALDAVDVPGIDRDVWHPIVAPAAADPGPARDLLLRAVDNGRAFRRQVLGDRTPTVVEWSGGGRNTWLSDVPRDLTVDRVWFVQAKYESTCVLSTSPAALVDHLLADDGTGTRRSWYEVVALPELQAYYDAVRQRTGAADAATLLADPDAPELPADVRDLGTSHRRSLKALLRAGGATDAEDAAYRDLSRAVSVETALRWEHRLRASTAAQRTQLLFRMLRIAGGPYWLLGTKGRDPVRLAVTDTRSWRERFELRDLAVTAGRAGQPQVDWRAEVVDRDTGHASHVEGYCELRWSHGKLQGNPECKVQVATPLPDLPGYDPMGR